MLIARDGEELACPKGTICGRVTRNANDQITDGDFAVLGTCFDRRPALRLCLL